VALRYHNVYGRRLPRDTPYAGVAALFRSALAHGEAPRVFEDGAQLRDFVHVRDVAVANRLALEHPDVEAGGLTAYNVASGTPRTVHELATALADAVGGPPPVVTGEYRVGDVRHVVASPSRARTASDSGPRPTWRREPPTLPPRRPMAGPPQVLRVRDVGRQGAPRWLSVGGQDQPGG
jgi:dTDP-L-rhamnose 4-epimerase